MVCEGGRVLGKEYPLILGTHQGVKNYHASQATENLTHLSFCHLSLESLESPEPDSFKPIGSPESESSESLGPH